MNAQTLATNWTRQYFKERGVVPTRNRWQQIYDIALAHFLAEENEE